jgi:hypothetical protein
MADKKVRLDDDATGEYADTEAVRRISWRSKSVDVEFSDAIGDVGANRVAAASLAAPT